MYHVMLYSAPEDPHQLRDLLVRVIGLHPTDAMVQCHAMPGILPDALSSDQAGNLASALAELGIRSELIPDADVIPVAAVKTFKHARCLAQGLEVLDEIGSQTALVDWARIAVVSIGAVPDNQARHWTEDLGFASPHHVHKTFVVPGHEQLELILILDHSVEVYRVDQHAMNYEYLGSRKGPHSTANFRLFIADVVAHSHESFCTPSTRAFLEHHPTGVRSFDNEDKHVRYANFEHLVQKRIRQEFSAPVNPVTE